MGGDHGSRGEGRAADLIGLQLLLHSQGQDVIRRDPTKVKIAG